MLRQPPVCCHGGTVHVDNGTNGGISVAILQPHRPMELANAHGRAAEDTLPAILVPDGESVLLDAQSCPRFGPPECRQDYRISEPPRIQALLSVE